ncbi:hypothetical protein [Chitinophaga varians]|uniref:hypothetical protein n=1 Tax=Chitinophaga varians TaxID=2202339 RepID=UPI00165FC518|nr:hypothetical protein [Chitinophaga varians]MBC9909011.1 hypothetical protein [Chitinophaga varians]
MRTILTTLLLIFQLGLMAQTKDQHTPASDLVKVLNRNARFPRELAEKKISAVFSLKINLSANGEIVNVLASKYFPEKMVPQLADPAIFKGINWTAIFKRALKDGDAVIIPFVAYDERENNATFYEYTAEDLFLYPGENTTPFVNALIMQTYKISYRAPVI